MRGYSDASRWEINKSRQHLSRVGIGADPLAQTPALPIGGVNWRSTHKLNFEQCFPKPRLMFTFQRGAGTLFCWRNTMGVFRKRPRQTIVVTNNAL